MNRREFTVAGLGAIAAALAAPAVSAAAGSPAPGSPAAGAADAGQPGKAGAEAKPHIAFLLYEGMTALDLIGPAAVLANGNFRVDYVWRDMNPVMTESTADKQLALLPTATFADIRETDVLCVPGTSNPYVQIERKDMVEWVARVGAKASWVTSVCTGSFILGAAGLLNGYKATSHWSLVDELAWFGAVPTPERVVRDRNRVTGAGVTSGIDFGLLLYSLMRDEGAARAQQLLLEYDPQPPFDSGSPETAAPDLVAAVRKSYVARLQEVAPRARQSLEEAAKRLGVAAPL